MGAGAAATACVAVTEPACAQASVTSVIKKSVLTIIFIVALFENFFDEFRGIGVVTLPEQEDRLLPHFHRSVALCDLHQLPQRGFLLGLAERDEPSIAVALPGVALASHVTYGIQFVRGLLTRQLER